MRRITTLSATLVLLAGCGTEGTLTDNPDTLAGSPDSEQPRDPDAELPPRPEVTLPCPIGHAEDEAGACIPVGIQGCADIFINPMTGLCEPGPEDCPPGHIPVFGEGCQSVNISGCVGSFIDPETGLCDPKPEDCPPGHMPVFDEGCVRVGVIAPRRCELTPPAENGGASSTTMPKTPTADALSHPASPDRAMHASLTLPQLNKPMPEVRECKVSRATALPSAAALQGEAASECM